MNAWPVAESYLLPDDLFCQPISCVTVSFTLFMFISSSNISHHCTYNWLLCDSVDFNSIWRASSIAKSFTRRSTIPACASIFVKVFVLNHCQCRFRITKSFLDYLLPHTYKLHPEGPLEVDDVPLGNIIAELTGRMFSLMRNMKIKFMVGVAFALFVPAPIANIGGS